MINHKVKCSSFEIANDKPFTLIAGPCQLENESHAMKISNELKKKRVILYSNYFFKKISKNETTFFQTKICEIFCGVRFQPPKKICFPD